MRIEIFVRLEARRFVEVPDDSPVAQAIRTVEGDLTPETERAHDSACVLLNDWRAHHDPPVTEWDRVDVFDEYMIEVKP